MRKILLIVLAMFAFAACGEDGADEGAQRPDCNKACQRANDEYIQPDQYTDYFVNDSDGGKDLVFYIVHDVPFPTAGEGVKCDVLKSFDAEGVSTNVVCGPRADVFAGSGGQSNNDEEEDSE